MSCRRFSRPSCSVRSASGSVEPCHNRTPAFCCGRPVHDASLVNGNHGAKMETFLAISSVRTDQMQPRFEADLRGDVEFGSLRVIRWRIARAKTRELDIANGHLLSVAEKIEARWIAIEAEHGEGALLDEAHSVGQMLAAPGWRFNTEPQLLANARVLRRLKGEVWWLREHRLDSLRELVQARTAGP